MPAHSPIPEPLIDLVARRLRILGHPVRIKLIAKLADGAATVQELTRAVNGVQQNVSQHLAILHEAGIVSRRKHGTHVSYELVDPYSPRVLTEAQASLSHQVDELSRLIAHKPEDA